LKGAVAALPCRARGPRCRGSVQRQSVCRRSLQRCTIRGAACTCPVGSTGRSPSKCPIPSHSSRRTHWPRTPRRTTKQCQTLRPRGLPTSEERALRRHQSAGICCRQLHGERRRVTKARGSRLCGSACGPTEAWLLLHAHAVAIRTPSGENLVADTGPVCADTSVHAAAYAHSAGSNPPRPTGAVCTASIHKRRYRNEFEKGIGPQPRQFAVTGNRSRSSHVNADMGCAQPTRRSVARTTLPTF